jgi:cathepsin L
MQKQAAAKGFTFSVGRNWVTDYLANGGDIRSVTGLVKSDADLEWSVATLAVKDDLPVRFDWREQVEGGLQPVKNQGSCGSCWAFSVTAVLESLLLIKEPGMSVDLAEQTLVSNCSNSGSCSGGYFSAFNFLKSPGLDHESADPYQARNTSCRSGLQPKARIKEWSYIKSPSGGSPSTGQLKTAIHTYGPISVTVNGSFSSYAGGIYNNCNRSTTNHMVTLEGWDDEGGYWIMRNSWGSSWGEGGYMRIKYTDSYGYKCNNIGQTAAYAVLTED